MTEPGILRNVCCASVVLAALIGVAAYGGDGSTEPPPPPPPPPPAPVAPVAVGSIPAQVMTAGQSVTVDVSPFFNDPDGGALTYTASSSAPAVVAVSISGSNLTVEAVAAGTATVTVTATDPDGLSATQSAGITVEAANQAPEAVGAIPPQTMTAGQSVTVDVSSFFSDPDGDELTYEAESSDAEVVAASIEGSELTVEAVAAGTATVTVTATDPGGLSAMQSAEITVEAANRAPEAVGTIPSQSMDVGDAATVDVSAFFSDPDGDELTYTAESSDAAVVTASLEGSSLTVTAVAAGTATVTVTAADPDGLTATQSAEVSVAQGNQAPQAVGTIPGQTMTVGDAVMVDVAPFFSDPDGDELTYEAESSDAAVVTASLEGSSLTVTAVAEGSATVTVTAADPDGLTAAQSAEVTVEAPGPGFRDDFDSDASLDDWEISDADAEVVDGMLHLTGTTDGRLGIADRTFESVLSEWTLSARMGRVTAEASPGLVWFTGHDRFAAARVELGRVEDRNYRFMVFDSSQSSWVIVSTWSGESDAVNEEAGGFTDLTLGYEDGEVVITAGDTELVRIDLSNTVAGVTVGDFLGRASGLWLATYSGTSVLFDWVLVTGTESSADISGAAAAQQKLDLAREMIQSSIENPIRLDALDGTRGSRRDR